MNSTLTEFDEPEQAQVMAAKATAHGLPVAIAAGMRWTLWPSLLALPFSYAINFLLARIGPEALGAYGVLNVYIALVFVFLFLGGCAVPMKFLPELDAAQRTSFLASYGVILMLGLIPWFVVAAWQPQLLRFIFGKGGDPMFQLLLVFLSPICLTYVLMITSLKAAMEMKWAQLLDRGITLGLAIVLVALFLADRTWLKRYADGAIWLTYIGLSLVAGAIGFGRLVSLGLISGRPRFWFPRGFWRYTLLLQSSSILNFLNARLDYLFVLDVGGIAVLGKYVAIGSIAGIVPRISGFVVDSLLPSLTNCLASGDTRSTIKVTETYLRLMFPTVLSLSLGIVLLVRPILAIMGPLYLELAPLVQIAAAIAAIQSLNLFGSPIFAATDCVQHDVISRLIRTFTFAGSFWPLWTHLGLRGAVFSWGLGELAYQAASLYLMRRNPRVKIRMLKTYAAFTAALLLSALPARSGLRTEYVAGALLAGLTLLAFLVLARYTVAEIRNLTSLITNTRVGPAA